MRIRWLVAALVISASLFWLAWRSNNVAPENADQNKINFADRPQAAPLEIFGRLKSAGQSLACQKGKCSGSTAPSQVPNPAEAVTDGQSWYYYETLEPAATPKVRSRSASRPAKLALKRFDTADNKTETIISTTNLTSPRGLFLSPDGQKLAFFSDNIVNPEKHLTELWVYDADSRGVRLLSEKLFVPDIRSAVHWNTSSTMVWFLADIGAQSEAADNLSLVTVSVQPPKTAVNFQAIPWGELAGDFDWLPMDVAPAGNMLAYARQKGGQTDLEVSDGTGTSVNGAIVYIQWLENGDLLYAAQDRNGFTFWRRSDKAYRFVAHRAGELASALGDLKGEYVVFVSQSLLDPPKLYALQIATGQVLEQAQLAVSVHDIKLARVRQIGESGQVAGTSKLDDAVLAAFVSQHLKEIVKNDGAKPLRLIVTDLPNVIYLDFKADKEARWLVRINDVTYAEWQKLAAYQPVKGDWQKIENLDAPDPKPVRLYEWETDLNQWVLKAGQK